MVKYAPGYKVKPKIDLMAKKKPVEKVVAKPVTQPVSKPITQPIIKLTKKKKEEKPITQPVSQPITQPAINLTPEKKTVGGAIAGMLTGKTIEEAAAAQGGKVLAGTVPIGPAAGIGTLAKTAPSMTMVKNPLTGGIMGTTREVATSMVTGARATIANALGRPIKNAADIVASKGLSSANVAKVASGKLISSVIRTTENLRTGDISRVAINTVNAAKATSYLTKLVQAATKPAAVLALIGGTAFTSLFWAPNEKGDALTTLQITQAAAAKNGDFEMVAEIDALIEETLGIAANIPVVGFIKATAAKFKAAAVASKTNMREAERMRTKRAEKEAGIKAGKLDPASPTADWNEITKDREVKRETERADDEAYFKKVEENRKKAKEEERADDEKYWAKISAEQQKKDEEKRRADNEYWAAIRKKKEDTTPSKLKFGLLK